MKAYFLTQISQISFYIGLFLVIAAIFHFPYTWIFFAGLGLMLTNDAWCRRVVSDISPEILKLFD